MLSRFACAAVFSSILVLHGGILASAQQPVAPAANAAPLLHPLGQVRLTIAQLSGALGDLNIPKWRTSGEIRQAMQANVDSMQRDVSGTLPTLISAAEANPTKISTALAVYRNVDALYDVLLRVSETAQLTGAHDAPQLDQQRAQLEGSRSQLGEALVAASQAQETEIVRLRSVAPSAEKPSKPTHIVVDDGPAARPRPHHHTTHTAPAKKPTTPPAQSTSPQQ